MTERLTHLSRDMIPAIEQEMKSVLRLNSETAFDLFYGMMHYHMGWADAALKPASVSSGKRIRPLFCLLTCAAAGGEWQRAVPAAAAIEILHNFSLIHDDIEDASPTRRGRDTVWKLWGVEQAINVGDAMFALAHLAMARLSDRGVPAAAVVEALRHFDETCVRLTQGQHADMRFETETAVTVDDYLAMIEGKTAVLIALSGELGALVAEADQETIGHYRQFGLHLGLAFQVIDDILGIWGDESLTGKSTATDISTRKKTLPVLFGLTQSEALRQLYSEKIVSDTFVPRAVRLLDEAGAYAYANDKANNYSQRALSHLEAAAPRGEAGEALYELAHMLLKRNF